MFGNMTAFMTFWKTHVDVKYYSSSRNCVPKLKTTQCCMGDRYTGSVGNNTNEFVLCE